MVAEVFRCRCGNEAKKSPLDLWAVCLFVFFCLCESGLTAEWEGHRKHCGVGVCGGCGVCSVMCGYVVGWCPLEEIQKGGVWKVRERDKVRGTKVWCFQ